MFGNIGSKLVQKIEAIRRFLDSISFVGGYVFAVLAFFGITSAALVSWFREQIVWFWNAYGLNGLGLLWLAICLLIIVTIRLAGGLFRTWRGAMGLALIAVAVLLGCLGAIMVAKDHTPANGPASAGTSSQDSSTRNESPLVWDEHLGHTYSGAASEILTSAIQIGAKNASDRELQLEDAYIISGEGYGKVSMKIGSRGGWIPPNEANPVPPGSAIVFRAEFPPTPAQEFFNRWKTIYLTVKHDGGLEIRKTIEERMVAAIYASFRPSPIGPQVTRRESGTSDQQTQTSTRPKQYTAYEKEQRLRAVDEIYGLIATKLTRAYLEGRDLFNNLKAEVAQGTAEKVLKDHYTTVEAAFADLRSLLKKYEYFSDIATIATLNTFNGLTEITASGNLISEIRLFQNIAPHNVDQLLDRDVVWMEARNANREFEKYLSETIPRLKQKRQEIESAELYLGTPK